MPWCLQLICQRNLNMPCYGRGVLGMTLFIAVQTLKMCCGCGMREGGDELRYCERFESWAINACGCSIVSVEGSCSERFRERLCVYLLESVCQSRNGPLSCATENVGVFPSDWHWSCYRNTISMTSIMIELRGWGVRCCYCCWRWSSGKKRWKTSVANFQIRLSHLSFFRDGVVYKATKIDCFYVDDKVERILRIALSEVGGLRYRDSP